jgi:hypothetical protein
MKMNENLIKIVLGMLAFMAAILLAKSGYKFGQMLADKWN